MENKSTKILLIDDDEIILNSLSTLFRSEGFEVITADGGNIGLIEALNNEPDLIITDIEMKDIDGMVLLKEVRKQGKWGEKVPVILLTNFDTDERILKGVVHDQPSLYLLKSKVNPRQILEKAKELLKINKPKNEL